MLYFGVRRPDLWESRTDCICCVCFFTVYTYVVDNIFWLKTWLVWIILLSIRILVVGIGRESALAYLYVLSACFILRRPVPIFGPGGLLSVKQMDPVSFSAEIVNSY